MYIRPKSLDSKLIKKEASTAQYLTVDYHEKELSLVRIKEKPDGKNSSDYDGFYATETSYKRKEEGEKLNIASYDKTELFFLKMFPQKESLWAEGFFEAFLGEIITKMIHYTLIPSEYSECFSPAEAVTIPNVGVALLQPYLKGARPLFKVSNEDQQKKRVVSETINRLRGMGYEQHTNNLEGEIHGLAYILMLMILFGNYSFHSGNMMVTDTNGRHVFTIIDYGAAFRNYFASKKQEDIWQSLEEIGSSFAFYEHKKYLDNYKGIPGLFAEVIKLAEGFFEELASDNVKKMELEATIQYAALATFDKVLKNKMEIQENNALAADRIIQKLYEHTGFSGSASAIVPVNFWNENKNALENNNSPELQMANFASEIIGIMRYRLLKITEAQAPSCKNKEPSFDIEKDGTDYRPDLDILENLHRQSPSSGVAEGTNVDAIYWSMSARNNEDEDEIAPAASARTPSPMS